MSGDPIAYIERTRAYYLALGYDNPYQWAQYNDVPFSHLEKPLSECRAAIVTTAAPFQEGKGDQGPGAAHNANAKFYTVYAQPITPLPDVRISHVAYDRDHTSAEDMGTWLPLAALKRAEEQGRVGSVAPRFFGLPTNRSIRTTTTVDCPALRELASEDQVDVAILVPNCPICHQSVALAARELERVGIATVIMGCARDIVEHVGVPRFLFSDYPLGNAAGRPNDIASQDETLSLALDLLEGAERPRTTAVSPLSWPGDGSWKTDYSNAAKLSEGDIRRKRQEFDRGKAVAKAIRSG